MKGFPYGLVVLASVLLPYQLWGCGFESHRCCSNPQMQKWNCFRIRTCPKEALTSVSSALTTRPRRHTKNPLTNRTCLSFAVSIENKKKIHTGIYALNNALRRELKHVFIEAASGRSENNLRKFFYILAKKGYFDIKNAEKVVKKQRRTFGKNLDQTWEKIRKKWPSLIATLINVVEMAHPFFSEHQSGKKIVRVLLKSQQNMC